MTKRASSPRKKKKAPAGSPLRNVLLGFLAVAGIMLAILFSPLNHLFNISLKDVLHLPVSDSAAYFTDPVLPGTLSGNSASHADMLETLSFTLDGKNISLPMWYSDLTALGAVCAEDDTQVLEPQSSATVDFTLNGCRFYAYLSNADINSHPYSECVIHSLSFYSMDDVKAVFPGDIATGSSTKEDVHAAYGTPADTSSHSDTYTAYKNGNLTFSYSVSGDVLSGFSVGNSAYPADFVTSEPSAAIPDYVAAYKAPAALSSDPADFTVSYGGDLYTLPMPASTLIANGWDSSPTYENAGTPHYLYAHGLGYMTMDKDGAEQTFHATNPSDSACVDENTMIYILFSGGSYGDEVPITVFGGITIGSTLAELQQAAAAYSIPCTTDEDLAANETVFYTMHVGTSQLYSFEVDTATRCVVGIALKNASTVSVAVDLEPVTDPN